MARQEIEYRVLEPTYDRDSEPLVSLARELNELGAQGFEFVGVVPLREIDGGYLVSGSVPIVVMSRVSGRD